MAGLVHGFLGMTQGLTQSWFLHASFEEQSSSSSQPTIGSGSTEIVKIDGKRFKLEKYKSKCYAKKLLNHKVILTVFVTSNVSSSNVSSVASTDHGS